MITKAEFLNKLKIARAGWDALLAQVSNSQPTGTKIDGDWSVKDIVAHVTWYEREMIGLVQKRALTGSDLWNLSQDERNAAIFEQNHQRTLDDVLAESHQVFKQLMPLLELLTDVDLNDATHFRDMPSDWKPWNVIAGNSFEHYPDHNQAIAQWLGKL